MGYLINFYYVFLFAAGIFQKVKHVFLSNLDLFSFSLKCIYSLRFYSILHSLTKHLFFFIYTLFKEDSIFS